MTYSKHAPVKVVRSLASLLAALTVTVGCVKPQSRPVDPNNTDDSKAGETAESSFYNDEIVGSAVISKSVPGFSIPTEKLFSFKTCVKDKRTMESIKGHKFIVHGGEKPVSVRSNESGCVNWQEAIGYNFLNDAKFLSLERFLEADGMHKGTRRLGIAINPWAPTEMVRDMERRPLPEHYLVSKEEAARALRGELKSGDRVQRPLWIDDLRLNVNHNQIGDAKSIDFSASMTPKILLKNLNDETDQVSMTDGVFSAQFWIVAKTDSQQCLVIAKSAEIKDLTMVGGKLRNEIPLQLRFRNTYGQLELVGRVSAQLGSAGAMGPLIMPFEGVWTMGDHQSLLGSKVVELRKPTYSQGAGGFSAEKYFGACKELDGNESSFLTERQAAPTSRAPLVPGVLRSDTSQTDAAANAGTPPAAALTLAAGSRGFAEKMVPADLLKSGCVDAKDVARLFPEDFAGKKFVPGDDFLSCENHSLPSGIERLEQFEFGHVEVRPEPIINPLETETTTERTIKFMVITQVTNPLAGGTIIRNVEFEIEKSDGTTEKVRTNHQGNLIFTDEIHHIYYQPERFMLKVVRVKHASGFTRRLGIVLNPWDNEISTTFARDIRRLAKETVAQVNLVPRPASQIILPFYQWGTQGFRYTVDDFMALRIYKQFNLDISPRVLRYSSLTGGRMRNDPLRDGIYLLKVAIQKDYAPFDGDRHEYITAVRKLVRVVAGRITTPIEVMFRDFRVMKIRDNLLIEIAPINEARLNGKQRQTLKVDGLLDDLIATNSGLEPRTFVGPVVPYSNGFSSLMRPTTDLAESYCATIDCDELKKNDRVPPSERGEEAKYFGSLKHLFGVTVSMLIERMKGIEAAHVASQKEQTRLSRLLKDGNLEYIPKYNEDVILKQDELVRTNNQVFPAGSAYASFIRAMTSTKSPMEQFDLLEHQLIYSKLVNSPSVAPEGFPESVFLTDDLNADKAARLCLVFADRMLLRQEAEPGKKYGWLSLRQYRNKILSACLPAVAEHTDRVTKRLKKGEVFSVERLVRVFNVLDSVRLGGNLMSITVGASSSMDRSKSAAFSYSLNPLAAPTTILKLVPGGEFFVDLLGLSVSMSLSESRSMGHGTSVSAGTSLAVETRAMKVAVDAYERCSAIRLSAAMVPKMYGILRGILRDMSPVEIMERVGRGLFLCEGALKKEPILLSERYYQFSQPIGDEVMNDAVALENHPYLLGVRGHSDYVRFVRKLEARPKSVFKLMDHESIAEVPINRLKGQFQSSMPTYPGLFLVEEGNISIDPRNSNYNRR